MQRITEVALISAPRGWFTRGEAACWLNASENALNALLKRAVASGEIKRIGRGLFCLDRRYLRESHHPFGFAQLVYGPSYLSLESALSWHGWIPEAVQAITSVSLKRSTEFATPFGLFSYTRVPQRTLFAGVERVEIADGMAVFIASPLKALADYIYAHRRVNDQPADLIGSLRLDEEALAAMSEAAYAEVAAAGHGTAIRQFMKRLRNHFTP